MRIDTSIIGIKMENPLMNASGVLCTKENELKELNKSKLGAFISKSCTIEKRIGNPEPRYSKIPLGSINSMGLPNEGFNFYVDYFKSNFNTQNKPFFISIAGLNLEENIKMVKVLNEIEEINLIEINLSCPNLAGKPQVGYDFEGTEKMLLEITKNFKKSFGVKLPPYFDEVHFNDMAKILNKFDNIKFVTCINSIGNGLMIDIEKEKVLIKPKNGYGGIGGQYVLPTALANVNKFYTLLPKKEIIGCGGVFSGEELFLHILCGASLVQIGTILYEEGFNCVQRILNEFKSIMEKKGYNCINDFKGKLRYI